MHTNQEPSPPKLLLSFLRFFLKPEYLEEIEGDMEEIFQDNLETKSVKKSRQIYGWEVLKLLRPRMIKHFGGPLFNNNGMFKNYLKIGWRNLLKYKGYTAINIFGLSVGIATTLVLLMIIHYEQSFDKDMPGAEKIHRLGDEVQNQGSYGQVVTPLMPILVDEIPEVITGTRFISFSWDYIEAGDDFIHTSYHFVDSGFAQTFPLDVLYGDLEYAVSTPGQAVLTESMANKIFNETNVVGQTIEFINQKLSLTVAAVVADRPENSNIQFNILVPWHNIPEWVKRIGDWYNTFMVAYVKLAPGVTESDLAPKLEDIKRKHYRKDRHETYTMRLLPLLDEHSRNADNKTLLSTLAIIAGVILVISCLNFINLSTTQSVGRAREIGIRKVMGSLRPQLIFQFLTESLLVSFAATLIGLGILNLILPKVNEFFDLHMTLSSFGFTTVALIIIVTVSITGLLAGLYPALFITRMKPVESLKNKVTASKSGTVFQKALLTIQFGSSILLIAGTLLIGGQINFMKTTELNFDGNETVGLSASTGSFRDASSAADKIKVLINELEASSLVKGVSTTRSYPGNYDYDYNAYTAHSDEGQAVDEIRLRKAYVDDRYFQTLGIPIVEGRDFSREFATEGASVIINESAMKQLGWTSLDNKFLHANGSSAGDRVPVVGVVADYHYQSLDLPIEPLLHYYSPGPQRRLLVKFQPGQVEAGLDLLKDKWAELGTYNSIDYDFIDEEFNKLYERHERLGTTIMVFSLIALVIAGLGLFSIASFGIKLKRKEVGVRKVLGASMNQLVALLSRNYVLLVLLALVIVSPVFYLLSENFLDDFANRINFDFSIIVLSGVVAVIIALVCVSFEAVRTALSNPVNHLRDE